jgi:integrating conjugative element protein (TIGR03755 family)
MNHKHAGKVARPVVVVVAAAAFFVASGPTHAQLQDHPRSQSRLYYRLGGGDPAARANNRNMVAIRLGLGGNLRLNYSCGRFDLGLSWSSLMNGISQLGGQVNNAIRAGIASLPMYFLQRAQPGLYELFQTYSQKADAMIAASLKTCEEMEAQIRNGGNPYEDWVRLAKGEAWNAEASTGGDVVTAKYNVERNGGANGVRWLGGQQRGGENQLPIRLIYDLTVAGYNAAFNSTNVTAGDNAYQAPAPSMQQTRLMQAFRFPSAAARYAQDVLGDMEISLCDTAACPTKATSTGTGLGPKFEAEVPAVEATLTQLVYQANPNLNTTSLDDLRAPGVAVSREVIDALREMPEPERTIAVKRLSQEIGLARTIDKALAIRNVLLTAMTLPEVTAAPVATSKAQEKITVMNRYIDDLLFENRVRRELVSNTSEILLDASQGFRVKALGTKESPALETRPLSNGRVQR